MCASLYLDFRPDREELLWHEAAEWSDERAVRIFCGSGGPSALYSLHRILIEKPDDLWTYEPPPDFDPEDYPGQIAGLVSDANREITYQCLVRRMSVPNAPVVFAGCEELVAVLDLRFGKTVQKGAVVGLDGLRRLYWESTSSSDAAMSRGGVAISLDNSRLYIAKLQQTNVDKFFAASSTC